MTPEHAQEPWARGERLLDIVSAKGNLVARLAGTAGKCEVEDANLRRIVACVNACEGIGTECLESMPINGSYLDAVCAREEWEARAIKEASRAADLQAQVDELLAALVNAKESLECCYDVTDWPCNGSTDQDKAIAIAAAAITKTTGETK